MPDTEFGLISGSVFSPRTRAAAAMATFVAMRAHFDPLRSSLELDRAALSPADYHVRFSSDISISGSALTDRRTKFAGKRYADADSIDIGVHWRALYPQAGAWKCITMFGDPAVFISTGRRQQMIQVGLLSKRSAWY